jgi:hypothetical protein
MFVRTVLPTTTRQPRPAPEMKTYNDAESRRLEERKRVNFPARIDSQGVKCLATVQDISRSGACLLVNRIFPAGAYIEVTLTNGIKRSGVVRRCLANGVSQKYDVGFEVTEASWPESLLVEEDG